MKERRNEIEVYGCLFTYMSPRRRDTKRLCAQGN